MSMSDGTENGLETLGGGDTDREDTSAYVYVANHPISGDDPNKYGDFGVPVNFYHDVGNTITPNMKAFRRGEDKPRPTRNRPMGKSEAGKTIPMTEVVAHHKAKESTTKTKSHKK